MTNASIQMNWDAQTNVFVNHRFNRPHEAHLSGNHDQNFRNLFDRMVRSGLKQFLLLLILLILAFAVPAQELPRALLITGNGNIPHQLDNYPPWTHEFHNDLVIQILDQIAKIDTATDMKDLNAENLRKYDLVISNSMFLTPDEKALNALWAFVADGKSYLTLHCGILSCLNWDKYEQFMGGFFVGGPATEPASFRVYTSNYEFWGFPLAFRTGRQHPVSLSVDDFDTKDELYYFQPTKQIDVIARAENHPIMWSHQVGAGRVMCLTLGHDAEAKKTPGYAELLRNGVRWLTGYPLIYLDRLPPVSTRSRTFNDFLHLERLSDQPQAKVKAQGDSSLFVLTQNAKGNLDLRLTGKAGKSDILLQVQEKSGRVTEKTVQLRVVPDGTGNLAAYAGNNVTATAAENTSPVFAAGNMIDGDTLSRWSSQRCEEAFLVLDLQQKYPIKQLKILWEASYASQYEVLFSDDSRSWRSVYRAGQARGGWETITTSGAGRYVKLLMQKKPPGKRGYSIYELEVY